MGGDFKVKNIIWDSRLTQIKGKVIDEAGEIVRSHSENRNKAKCSERRLRQPIQRRKSKRRPNIDRRNRDGKNGEAKSACRIANKDNHNSEESKRVGASIGVD